MRILFPLLALALTASLLPLSAPARTGDAGLYAIWYGKHNQHLLDLPFIVGGQVVGGGVVGGGVAVVVVAREP